MTDTDKIDALTELLSNVIHSLEMTQYDIDDATESHNVVVKADNYHQQMIDILYGVPDEELAHRASTGTQDAL